ncbi:MAG TPA: hypothetical protein VJ952_01000 [Opitutales bacterium]|nr:hypothetical protein [Opitutales bacterium]
MISPYLPLTGLLTCLFLSSCASTQTIGSQSAAKVHFHDDMTHNWQDNWFLDGEPATVEQREGGLYFSGGTVTKQFIYRNFKVEQL